MVKYVTFNNITSYSQLTNNQVRNTGYLLLNVVYGQDWKRKLWVETYRKDYDRYIHLKLVAHKKTWAGWNKYNTVSYIRLNSYSGSIEWAPLGTNLKNTGTSNFYSIGEIPSRDFHKLLRSKYASDLVQFTLTSYSRGLGTQRSFDTSLRF